MGFFHKTVYQDKTIESLLGSLVLIRSMYRQLAQNQLAYLFMEFPTGPQFYGSIGNLTLFGWTRLEFPSWLTLGEPRESLGRGRFFCFVCVLTVPRARQRGRA